jgi:hypothetical protein
MKKLLLFAGILLPAFSSAQSAEAKNSVKSYYEHRGYNVRNEYNFTMKQGGKREAVLFFEGGTDYVVFLVPNENGVNDSKLVVEQADGDMNRQWINETFWEEVLFGADDDRIMKIKVACINSYQADHDYAFSVVIMGRLKEGFLPAASSRATRIYPPLYTTPYPLRPVRN